MAYELRISDWSSDVCSSDLLPTARPPDGARERRAASAHWRPVRRPRRQGAQRKGGRGTARMGRPRRPYGCPAADALRRAAAARRHSPGGDRKAQPAARRRARSEEHTSELQSLMRISYAVFCLKKKTNIGYNVHKNQCVANTTMNYNS